MSPYYDPQTYRFLNADALFVAGNSLTGSNMFTYCANNPVMYSDPSGYDDSLTILVKLIIYMFALFPYLPTEGVKRFTQMAICTDGPTGGKTYGSKSHQEQTAYSIDGKYLDPTLIRYVVLQPDYEKNGGKAKYGDVAIVADYDTGKIVVAIIGERGGDNGIYGEVSLSVAWDLGYSWADGSKAPSGNFGVIYFPGSRKATQLDFSSINTLVASFGWTKYNK